MTASSSAPAAPGAVHYLPTFSRQPFAKRDKRRRLPPDVLILDEHRGAKAPAVTGMSEHVRKIRGRLDAFRSSLTPEASDRMDRHRLAIEARHRLPTDTVESRAAADADFLQQWASRAVGAPAPAARDDVDALTRQLVEVATALRLAMGLQPVQSGS